jgi:hypothetical protein
VKFSFIQAEIALEQPIGTVSELCRALGVSRAGFYAWGNRPESLRAKEDCLLAIKVAEAHAIGRGNYGSPRVHRELTEQGFKLSRKRVIRLMQEQGLVGRPPHSFTVTTDSECRLSEGWDPSFSKPFPPLATRVFDTSCLS